MTRSFGGRLGEAIDRFGGLTVGIDPHTASLEAWGLPVTASGVERFGRATVEAAAGRVGIVKPQVALFERFGSAGFAALERVHADARSAGLLLIADAKRADIGSSNAGYAEAWLSRESPLAADALTVSPYLGVQTLAGLAEAARANDAGLFVLAATSNPEAEALQAAVAADESGATPSVARLVTDQVQLWNAADRASAASGGAPVLGSFGIVFGATFAPAARGLDIRTTEADLPVLAPGFGAQGANLAEVGELFPGDRHRILASVSRSVTSDGADRVADQVDAAIAALRAGWDATAGQVRA